MSNFTFTFLLLIFIFVTQQLANDRSFCTYGIPAHMQDTLLVCEFVYKIYIPSHPWPDLIPSYFLSSFFYLILFSFFVLSSIFDFSICHPLFISLICIFVISSVHHMLIAFCSVASSPFLSRTFLILSDLIPSTTLYNIKLSCRSPNSHVDPRFLSSVMN